MRCITMTLFTGIALVLHLFGLLLEIINLPLHRQDFISRATAFLVLAHIRPIQQRERQRVQWDYVQLPAELFTQQPFDNCLEVFS